MERLRGGKVTAAMQNRQIGLSHDFGNAYGIFHYLEAVEQGRQTRLQRLEVTAVLCCRGFRCWAILLSAARESLRP